ncbi:hypothetical protein [Dolichospermum sp. LEGE 00246]|uniref:hypothetical protein n=1 Tax=Dolichospermum sp. LEGE 00246 TaxID=1828605 RepID=UPI0018829A2E|nr:hypothetical protein [Dolichospermum sp. LEGE 00246]MBE9256620.1 hypothetical protein [Dolichospermum sp. LEGE 00246]
MYKQKFPSIMARGAIAAGIGFHIPDKTEGIEIALCRNHLSIVIIIENNTLLGTKFNLLC